MLATSSERNTAAPGFSATSFLFPILPLSRRYCCAIYFRFVFSLSRYVGSRVGNGESGRRACVRHSGFLLFFFLSAERGGGRLTSCAVRGAA